MITINLLPPVKKNPFLQARHSFAIAAVLFVLCLGSFWGYLLYTEQKLETELQQVRQQHELFKPTLTQMQTATAKQQAITARQTILLALTQERPPLYAAITRLGAIIPNGVWLTEVTGDKNNLKIAGMAKNYPDVAEFLKKAQDNVMFTEFTLIRAEQDKTNANFEFRVKFKGM
jgi:type IV pilus assembly protein PilN